MGTSKQRLSFRVIAFIMAVLVGVTFMPLLGNTVNAATKAKKNKQINTKQVMKYLSKSNEKIGAANKIGGNSYATTFNVSNPNSSGYVTISGNLTGTVYYFCELYVDDSYVQTINNKSFSISLDMKKYKVGYHTIIISLKDNNGALYYDGKFFVPTYFYAAPPNYMSYYDVYAKYFIFNGKDNDYDYGGPYESYAYPTMEVRVKGKKKWKAWKNKGLMDPSSYNNYKFPGIKTGKKFQTRLRYTKSFNYPYKTSSGTSVTKQFTFRSRTSAVRTFKAGGKKLKIKSVRVKPYAVKRHVQKNFYFGFFRRYYLGKTVWYTYKYKVIIKLKKKPGAKGLMVNNTRIRGNKKTYVKYLGYGITFAKPSQIRIPLAITSYQSKVYGGWSKLIKKKRRIK